MYAVLNSSAVAHQVSYPTARELPHFPLAAEREEPHKTKAFIQTPALGTEMHARPLETRERKQSVPVKIIKV